MKKFLLSMLLVLIGAMWSSVDARWDLGNRKNASQIQPGDTVVIEICSRTSDLGNYIWPNAEGNGAVIKEGIGLEGDAVFVVEEGPLDIRTNAPTVYLKMISVDKYLGSASGSPELISDIANAANYQILSCAEDIPWSNTYAWDEYKPGVLLPGTPSDAGEVANWRSNAAGRGSDDNSVGFSLSKDENSWTYLACWAAANSNVMFWTYTDTQQWNVYEAHYVSDLIGDLETLIDQYIKEGEFIGGTDPGFYDEELAEVYTLALANAYGVLASSATDEELAEAIADLKAAHAAVVASRIPLTEGYYYFVSAHEAYLNDFGVEKAAYANIPTMQLYYKNFDPENVDFVFELSKADEENEWWVQHMASGVYVGKPSAWYNVTPPVTYGKEEPQWIKYYDGGTSTGKWFWGSHSEHSTSYTPNHGNASDNEGAMSTWGTWTDTGTVQEQFNCWYLRKITDQAVIDGFEEQRAQAQRTQTLTELVNEANELYGKLFAYTAGTDGLITNASGGARKEPDADNQITFQTIRVQGEAYDYMADNYSYLIDGRDTTYMQGSGYIQIDISKTPADVVTFEYNARGASGEGSNPNWQVWGANERPNTVQIYATNDTANADSWAMLGTVEMGTLELPARATVNLGAEYGFIRYNVINNAAGGNYFTISEFQVYKSTVNKEESQYYTTEGLSTVADAMNDMLPEMRDLINANSATDDDVARMSAALKAVKELYADADALGKLIVECETIIDGVNYGDGMGELSDESLATALQSAIDKAKAVVGTIPVVVADVKAAEAALIEAKATFLAGIKTVEVGKWYFITNLDQLRTGAPGADDSFCGGNAIYLADKYAGSSVTKWGLFDEVSMNLNADNNPKAMWRFVPVDGTEYYAIQNMYSGYYMGDYAGDEINLPVSEQPVPYEVAYSGNAEFILYPRGGKNRNNYALWPEGAKNDVVCHVATPGTASAWTFIEIDPEEQMAISISDFGMNLIDVMAVPYDVDLSYANDDDVHGYAIKSMTKEEREDGTSYTVIELYEKTYFKAGEPCIITLGDWEDEDKEVEPYELVIPFPTEMVDHTASFISNGIVGGLHGIECPAGSAVSSGKRFNVADKAYKFDAQTGAIDAAFYKGEVEGVETAKTIVIEGLVWPATGKLDVNGDGEINSSDVVAIYDHITNQEESNVSADAADANGDGDVNSSDVVAIYDYITNNQ